MLRTKPGFSLLELLVSIAVIALLLGLLLPLLSHARHAGYQAACANNLRQMGAAWQAYLQDNKELFPKFGDQPEWTYGGVEFIGAQRTALLAEARPINRYIADSESGRTDLAGLFRCPADSGVYERGRTVRGQAPASVLPNGYSCYEAFGTSYRANGMLLDSSEARIDDNARPLALHEIHVDFGRMLLTGDTAWYYATRDARDPEARLDASWHKQADSGNMLAVDGSIRFIAFAKARASDVALHPRPELDE